MPKYATLHALSRTAIFFGLALFLICIFHASPAYANRAPKILVLHSYHKGYRWTDTIMEGIDQVFSDKMPQAELFVEYMDTKRYMPAELFKKLESIYATKYKNIRFDVILASDDNALNFLMVFRKKLFGDIPIVFCGINSMDEYHVSQLSHITGVIEDFDLKATLDIALKFHPNTRNVVSINDDTISSIVNINRLRQLRPRYKNRLNFIELSGLSVDELKTKLKTLPKNSIILHLNFFRDRLGQSLTYKESIKLVTENCNLPMYVAWEWYLGSGVVGGMMISGRLQGESCADLAVQLLNGAPFNDIPIVTTSPNIYMFDYEQLAKFRIPLKLVPEDSVVINIPQTFYYRYKSLIWTSFAAFVMLAIIILFLSLNIVHRRRTENELNAIFENSLVGILLLKGNRYVAKMNKRITDIFGYTPEDMLGKDISIIHASKDTYDFFSKTYYQKLVDKELIHVEYQYQRKDGQNIWCLLSGKAIHPPSLDKGVIWVIDEITHRKENEEALQQAREDLETRVRERTSELMDANTKLKKEMQDHARAAHALRQSETKYYQNLESIFGSLPDAIVTVGTDMRVLEANKSFETISGRTRDEILGLTLETVLSTHHQPCLEVLKHTLSTKTGIKEHRAQCPEDNPKQTVILSTAPFHDHEGHFTGAVLAIRDISRLVELEKQLEERTRFHSIIGKSEAMLKLFDVLENLADYDTTVLITGESGTGKELVAEALHKTGSTCDGPFIKVNCSALSENLLESELFGHVRGAFTGAYKDKIGRFEAAQGGTVLLDEIGDISPGIQLKLLRFLDYKEFERVGESKTIKADVRLLAATNVDLQSKVQQGHFREDLYYRLKVMVVSLPSLRERTGDIKLLVEHYVDQFRQALNKDIHSIHDRAMAALMAYHWPGNVRELKHAMEHACIVCTGRTIGLDHLPVDLRTATGTPAIAGKRSMTQQKLNHEAVLNALTQSKWNKTKAAKLLGISRRHLYRKIEQFGI